jgi:hypothetical protein
MTNQRFHAAGPDPSIRFSCETCMLSQLLSGLWSKKPYQHWQTWSSFAISDAGRANIPYLVSKSSVTSLTAFPLSVFDDPTV